jgi:hypothetical protein
LRGGVGLLGHVLLEVVVDVLCEERLVLSGVQPLLGRVELRMRLRTERSCLFLLSGSLERRVSFGGSCSTKGLSWTASRAFSCLPPTLLVLLVLSSKLFVLLVVEALSCFFVLLVAEALSLGRRLCDGDALSPSC